MEKLFEPELEKNQMAFDKQRFIKWFVEGQAFLDICKLQAVVKELYALQKMLVLTKLSQI